MNRAKVAISALAVAAFSMLVPAAATAVPPTFDGTLAYGPNESSLVATGTITSGSSQYFEVWLSQQTGTPTDVQFESNPAGIDGSCSAGVQAGRGFVQCTPLAPVATTGTTLTTRFNLPAAYPANGGAQMTMIAPPGGVANTATINLEGPAPLDPGPGGGEGIFLKGQVKWTEVTEAVYVEATPTTANVVSWLMTGELLVPLLRGGRAAAVSKKKAYDLNSVNVVLQPNVATKVGLKAPRKTRNAVSKAVEEGKKVKVTITASATSSSGQPLHATVTDKVKPKK